jgi:hypothetical protein
VCCLALSVVSPTAVSVQLEDELAFTKSWLHNHVSDHSAVNHRVQVLSHVLSASATLEYICSAHFSASHTASSGDKRILLLGQMLCESEESLLSRPGQESLWYLRRTLLELLLYTLDGGQPATCACTAGGQLNSLLRCTVSDLNFNTGKSFVQLLQVSAEEAHRERSGGQAGSEKAPALLLRRLMCLVQCELSFADRCRVEQSSAWNSEAQALFAARYARFLLERTMKYCGVPASSAGDTNEHAEGTLATRLREQLAARM